ncbi:MAG: hypothetical protein U0Q16_12320 [Bryobacteraceae bacterium]
MVASILSVVLPLAGAGWAVYIYKVGRPDTVGAAIGVGIAAYLVFAIACVLGEIAAVVALIRGERPSWIAVIGALLNLTAVIPPVLVLQGKA